MMAVLPFASCYEDKGSYDYNEGLELIGVAFPDQPEGKDKVTYIAKINDVLEIEPAVTYSQEDNLRFLWELYTGATSTDSLSTTNKLTMKLPMAGNDIEEGDMRRYWSPGLYRLRYTVMDDESKLTTQKLVYLRVMPITPVGMYVMHDNGSQTEVATIENDDFLIGLDEAVVNATYFSDVTGKTIPGKGRSIVWYTDTSYDEADGMLFATDRDMMYANLKKFTLIADNKAAMFKYTVPATIDKITTIGPSGQIAIFADNGIFIGGCEFMHMAHYGSKLDVMMPIPPYVADDPVVSGYYYSDGAQMGWPNDYFMPVYDTEARALRAASIGYADVYVDDLGTDVGTSAYNPYAVGAGHQLVGIDYGEAVWYYDHTNHYGEFNQWAILRSDDGSSVKAYRINTLEDAENTYDTANEIATGSHNSELLDINCFQMSTKTDGRAFISTPDAVYTMDILYDADSDAVEIFRPATPAEKITKIRLLKYNSEDYVEGSGSEPGFNEAFKERLNQSLYIVTHDGSQGRIYRIGVTAQGGLDAGRTTDKWEGFGEISDICFRLR